MMWYRLMTFGIFLCILITVEPFLGHGQDLTIQPQIIGPDDTWSISLSGNPHQLGWVGFSRTMGGLWREDLQPLWLGPDVLILGPFLLGPDGQYTLPRTMVSDTLPYSGQWFFQGKVADDALGNNPSLTPGQSIAVTPSENNVITGSYAVIAWNDLGMHCIDPTFAEFCMLPPYNTIQALVLQRGEEPKFVTSGVRVTYELINNTTVQGKTNFWQHVSALFGQETAEGTGLTGNGLSGQMDAVGRYFEAAGIPAVPVNDSGEWNPYQLARVKVFNQSNSLLAQTTIVVPVSDETHCNECHGSRTAILSLHDVREGTNLLAEQPVLCARCHADVALGQPGDPGTSNFSLAMHGKHASLPIASRPNCQHCHPGPVTQCNRSALPGMGPLSPQDPNCEACHGDLATVAAALRAGRSPWLEEPTCIQCHQGARGVDTGTTLYRHARGGHHGVYCIACHNSPHAWLPSMNMADNLQPLLLQGGSTPLGAASCLVCHTTQMDAHEGPHREEE